MQGKKQTQKLTPRPPVDVDHDTLELLLSQPLSAFRSRLFGLIMA